jgi:hypothetical protein
VGGIEWRVIRSLPTGAFSRLSVVPSQVREERATISAAIPRRLNASNRADDRFRIERTVARGSAVENAFSTLLMWSWHVARTRGSLDRADVQTCVAPSPKRKRQRVRGLRHQIVDGRVVTPGSVYAHIDQSLGAWEQQPVFKTNVQSFVALRKLAPSIELLDLQRITDLFPHQGFEFKLDPSFEPREEGKPAARRPRMPTTPRSSRCCRSTIVSISSFPSAHLTCGMPRSARVRAGSLFSENTTGIWSSVDGSSTPQ